MDLKLYGKKEDFDKLGKESAICLANHRSDVDWLIGYTLADRAGVLAVRTFSMGIYLVFEKQIKLDSLPLFLKMFFFIDSNFK